MKSGEKKDVLKKSIGETINIFTWIIPIAFGVIWFFIAGARAIDKETWNPMIPWAIYALVLAFLFTARYYYGENTRHQRQ